MYFYLSVEFQLFALCNVSLNIFASNIYFFVSMRVLIIYQENYKSWIRLYAHWDPEDN